MHTDETHYSAAHLPDHLAAPIGADEAAGAGPPTRAHRRRPILAGQYAHYIAFELQMWRRGFRNSSPDSMAPIAKRLDDQQIAAVAAYYQQVRSSNGVATTK
jgi:cytochrome c553